MDFRKVLAAVLIAGVIFSLAYALYNTKADLATAETQLENAQATNSELTQQRDDYHARESNFTVRYAEDNTSYIVAYEDFMEEGNSTWYSWRFSAQSWMRIEMWEGDLFDDLVDFALENNIDHFYLLDEHQYTLARVSWSWKSLDGSQQTWCLHLLWHDLDGICKEVSN